MFVRALTRVARFSAALHGAGAPSHIIEGLVAELYAAEGLDGTIVASPTAIWLMVDDRTRVLRLEPGDIHLDRLSTLYDWHARAVEAPSDAELDAALDAVLQQPAPWSARVQPLAFAGIAGIAGWLIGGSAIDLVASTVGGLYVSHALAALSTPSWRPLAMLATGALGGLLGGFAALVGAHPAAVSLATVIVVVPGLGMTVALAEVAAGHWSSGGARLLGAMAAAGQLAGGLALGAALTAPLPQGEPPVALGGASLVAPLLGSVLFAVLLHGRPSHIPATMGVSALGFAIATSVPGSMGAGLAALAVGLAANLLSRARNLPALATSLPGILLLVPGSVSVRGLERLIAGDPTGTQTAVDALFAAGALALGLFAAHALLPARPLPRRVSSDPHSLEAPCSHPDSRPPLSCSCPSSPLGAAGGSGS